MLLLSNAIALASANALPLFPDLRFGLNGRSYPVGAQLVGSAGVAVPIWGSLDAWKYGYTRVALNGGTSAVVNRIGAEVQFFPISILGVSAGFDSGVRNFVPKFLDCGVYECTGRVDRNYLRFILFGAVKDFSFNLNFRTEVIRSYGSGKPFFDEMTLVRGRSSGETITTFSPILLYRLSEEWSVGGASLYSTAVDSGGFSHLYGPIVSWTDSKQWSVAGGIGLNESVIVRSGISLFFTAQFVIEPSLQISDLRMRKSQSNRF
jgi:hypothetical protein